MVNTVWVNADHWHDLHPLAEHMTKLKHFTKEENRNFSTFRYSFHVMLQQALKNVIVCLMISHKLQTKVAQKS